jgi:hypothetical protein
MSRTTPVISTGPLPNISRLPIGSWSGKCCRAKDSLITAVCGASGGALAEKSLPRVRRAPRVSK